MVSLPVSPPISNLSSQFSVRIGMASMNPRQLLIIDTKELEREGVWNHPRCWRWRVRCTNGDSVSLCPILSHVLLLSAMTPSHQEGYQMNVKVATRIQTYKNKYAHCWPPSGDHVPPSSSPHVTYLISHSLRDCMINLSASLCVQIWEQVIVTLVPYMCRLDTIIDCATWPCVSFLLPHHSCHSVISLQWP